MSKLWGGRFKKELDEDAKEFSYSFHIDQRLYWYDIQTNKAYAAALNKANYLTDEEKSTLSDCLESLVERFEKMDIDVDAFEDVHTSIEYFVTEKCGDVGKKLHTGKSRNDQVMTDIRLYLKDEVLMILNLIEQLLKEIWGLANQHKAFIFPGFTHFQPAQPVVLGHHLLAYFEMFSRDEDRFNRVYEAADVCPLGSGALAGNNFNLDREFMAKTLGFSQISANSMDAVADRDFMLEFCSDASICMMHLSRFCEELILWSSPLLGFVTLSDDFTTGSSLMPQKKNPDIAELIRGKSGRVIGHYVGLFNTLKALPLTYNRDLQEDKEILFDTVDTLKDSLLCFTKMIKQLTFNKEAIDTALNKGYLLATDFADYLVKKGIPFREAHDLTGKVVVYAQENKKQLEALTLDEFQKFSDQIEKDIFDVLTLEKSVEGKSLYGGTAPKQVEEQLKTIKEVYKW